MIAERLSNFFKYLEKNRHNISSRMAKNVLKSPARALDISANVASSIASRNPRAALLLFTKKR